ncbi:L-lactate permease [Streptomyces sp. NPDC003635]
MALSRTRPIRLGRSFSAQLADIDAALAGAGATVALPAAANSSGGILGKMISPQDLTIACAAVGLAGKAGDLLRKRLPWSIGLLTVRCLIVVGQGSPVPG